MNTRKQRKIQYKGGNNDSTNITTFFPDTQYKTTITDKSIRISNKLTNETCLLARHESHDDAYIIDEFGKCGADNGTTMLHKFKEWVKTTTIKKVIIDSDESFLLIHDKITIDLPKLFLLTEGKTWYNKMGFEKPYYPNILYDMYANYQHYISQPISNLEVYPPNQKENVLAIIQGLTTNTSSIPQTIQTTFIDLKEKLVNNKLTNSQIQDLSFVLTKIKIPNIHNNLHGLVWYPPTVSPTK